MHSGQATGSGKNGYKQRIPPPSGLPTKRAILATVSCLILLGVAIFLIPVVPYSQQVTLNYGSGVLGECLPTSTPTCQTGAQTPVDVTRYATVAYSLLNYGMAPFSNPVLVTQGNHSAIVFFSGTRAVAAEGTGAGDVKINPQGSVFVEVAAVTSSDYGQLNITIRVKSYSPTAIGGSAVYLSMEGYSSNYTSGGLTWVEPRLVGTCGAVWPSGTPCTVSTVTGNALPANRSFYYYVEVRGHNEEGRFVYRQGFEEEYPEGGVGPIWVSQFISQVDKSRSYPLVENSTLDRIAEIRFMNASAHYQTSDWGFTNDTNRYLGANRSTLGYQEALLYPLKYTPDSYATFLSNYAPGHWTSLTDGYYAQYGYFVGQGPYYEVSVPCSIYEIPHAGLNIQQFFLQQGCTSTVLPATWLVVILSS
jgi:hypothetical protein